METIDKYNNMTCTLTGGIAMQRIITGEGEAYLDSDVINSTQGETATVLQVVQRPKHFDFGVVRIEGREGLFAIPFHHIDSLCGEEERNKALFEVVKKFLEA